jgi:two-component system response regulator NreC
MPLMSSVLVVEDHPIFRKGLVHLLAAEPGLQVVAEASNRHEALAALEDKRPHVVLVDLTLGEDSGLDLIKDIHFRFPDTRVLVLSMHDEKYYADRSLAAGALGYCMKEEAVDHLVSAIRTVAAGKVWVSPRQQVPAATRRADRWQPSIGKLSDREFQVFALIGKGLGTAEIAVRLNLSAKTVDTHKENMKGKLSFATSRDLRQFAVEWHASENRV